MPGVMAMLAAWWWILLPRAVRRQYEQTRHLRNEVTFQVSGGGIETDSGTSRIQYAWSDFRRWKEDEQLFLLQLSDVMYLVIPKRFAAATGDIDEFRSILDEAIGTDGATSA